MARPGAAALAAVATVALLAAAAAQVPFLGKCPKREVVQKFNVSSYLGKWYEQERYFAVFQLGGNCVTATYIDKGEGMIGVENSQRNLVTGRTTTLEGTATVVGEEGEGKLEVKFPSAGDVAAPYWVLDTDYKSYSIVWSCTPLFGNIGNAQFAWVLTRSKNPGLEVMAQVRDVLEQMRVEVLPFRRSLQVCDDN